MKKVYSHLKDRITAQWSWWDSLSGFCVGFVVGGIIVIAYSTTWRIALRVIEQWASPIVHFVLATFLIGRIFAVARWPRKPPLDYSKITWPGVVASNLITIILGIALLAVIFDSAPKALIGLSSLFK